MSKVKISRKDLKEDEFKTWSVNFEHMIENNLRSIIIGTIVILVIIVGYQIIKSQKAAVLSEANSDYAIAQNLNFNVINLYRNEDKENRKNVTDSANKYIDSLIEKRGSSEIGRKALFLKANLLFQEQDFDRAITTANSYLEQVRTKEERANAYLLLGYCLENKFYYQQFKGTIDTPLLDQAMKNYQQAAQEVTNTYIYWESQLSQARIYDLKMETDKALALLKKVQDERKWFTEYEKTIANYPKDSRYRDLLISIEKQGNITTFAETAKLYSERLKGFVQ